MAADRQFEHGRAVFGAGAGLPYFSTDTVAAQRALEVGADVLLMGKQGVDGVYSADPHRDPTAVKYDELTYDEYLAKDLKVADATAISMARDYKLAMVFFGLDNPGEVFIAADRPYGLIQATIRRADVPEEPRAWTAVPAFA